MILKGFLAPLYLLQNFSEKKIDVKGDTEDNPQLSDPFLLLCQWFFPETKNPN